MASAAAHPPAPDDGCARPAGRHSGADAFRGRLVTLEDIQALASWLERRPQLGHEVFARGRPEFLGNAVVAGEAIDVVEALWARLALFGDEATVDTTEAYRARPFELYAVAEGSRAHPAACWWKPSESHRVLRRRSAWFSTPIVELELAKQGDVVLGRGDF